MTGAAETPNNPGRQPETKEELPREEPGTAVPAEGKGGQDQDGLDTAREKTFLQHAKDAMEEHDLLGRLLAR